MESQPLSPQENPHKLLFSCVQRTYPKDHQLTELTGHVGLMLPLFLFGVMSCASVDWFCCYENLLFFFNLSLAALGLGCCTWTFSSCSEWGLLSGCSAQVPHCIGFSCCGTQALECEGFIGCSAQG